MEPLALLRRILLRLATAAASGAAYAAWSDNFARKEVREEWLGTGRDAITQRLTIDQLREIGVTELKHLGFSQWDEDGLMLVPLWAFNYLADGEELTSISGEKVSKGKDYIDLDIRGGVLAYGFMD